MIRRKLSSLLLSTFFLSLFPQVATAQQIDTGIPEVHPRFRTQECTESGGCKTQQTYLVSDARHRPFHNTEGEIVECSAANKVLCPDEASCAKNCILEGVEYGSLGVLASDTAVTLRNYLFDGRKHRSISPRVYLLAEDGENYEPINLLNQEISFQVDVSNIGCGMNGALYLSEMDFAGGRSKLNPAGAKYATGYCDAPSNSRATTMTSHPCNQTGPFLCNGDQSDESEKSGSGMCARKGCGINPFRLVTYSSNIKAPIHANISPSGGKFEGALTEGYCSARDFDHHARLSGLKTMGEALGRGMVMVLSIWNSERHSMAWLNAGKNGSCQDGEGKPERIVKKTPNVTVTFSNIRWGDIDSTA
ncbi:glycoside hydrolase [Neurospora hispaniola]|uniref:Glucanase n=1 Tax=Neurospora hispaniola TaxID=588809 RepID=A0AAJ0I7Q0_9PEZI|nr:glycoside hydrolase [Neurospora hispaniola]